MSSPSKAADFYVIRIMSKTTPNPNDGNWKLDSGGVDDPNGPANKVYAKVTTGAIRWDWNVPWTYIEYDLDKVVTVTETYSVGASLEGAVFVFADGAAGLIKGTIDQNYKVTNQYSVSLYKWEIQPYGGSVDFQWKLGLKTGRGERNEAIGEYFLVVTVDHNKTVRLDNLQFEGHLWYGAFPGAFEHLWAKIESIDMNYYAGVQNDAEKGVDAGNTFSSATSINPGTYSGTLYLSLDKNDWYRFYVSSGQDIYVTMTPPAGVDFDLQLYNPSGTLKDASYAGPGYTDSVSYYAGSSGYWRIRIYIYSGEGQYSFDVSVTTPPPGGGEGCPYVSTWNGNKYVLDNNLLPASESSGGATVTDYYLLQQTLAQREDGSYSLLLSEFENEHSFFDRVQLLAVDYPSDVNVAASPFGEVLTYTEPSLPLSAITNEKKNMKHLLNAIDGNYYEGHNGSYITLNFGDGLDVSQGAKLVMRADFEFKESILIQVQDADGNWNTVATVIPRVYWATEIIDMSKHLPDTKGNLKVRLYFTANHKIDFVGLDTSPQATSHVQEGDLVSAIHSVDGDVTASLLHSDDTYAELVPGQEIELTFTLPPQTMETRDYIITTEGHYYPIQT